MEKVENKKGLTGSTLKIIACISMLIDHITVVFLANGLYKLGNYTIPIPVYAVLRWIGRLAFPIFCYFIVEGFKHTKSRQNYLMRLIFFGFISEIPFNWASYSSILDIKHQNVYFTLAIGLISLVLCEKITKGSFKEAKISNKLLAVLAAGACAVIAELLKTSYGYSGVLCIFIMYILNDKPLYRNVLSTIALMTNSISEIFAIPFWFLINRYNGEKGSGNKYLFYLFYPGHLLILAVLRYIILKV